MPRSWTQRLAQACAVHPWRTVGSWAVVVALAMAAIAILLGGALTTEGNVTSRPESVRGLDLLDERFPQRDDVSELVVVRAEDGAVDTAEVRDEVSGLRSRIAGAEGVVAVADPYGDQA